MSLHGLWHPGSRHCIYNTINTVLFPLQIRAFQALHDIRSFIGCFKLLPTQHEQVSPN